MSRCDGCVTGTTVNSFIFYNQPVTSPLAQWTVKLVTPLGRFKFTADNGNLLALCTSNCGGTVTFGVGVAVLTTATALPANNYIWTIVQVPDSTRVTITGANGNFLARCVGCWQGARNQNGVFVHTKDNASYAAQWTP